MAENDDPQRERRLAAFRRWVEPGSTMALERDAFLKGCDYEANLLGQLLERMVAQRGDEIELLRAVAAVVDGWTGGADDMRAATEVFARVARYVKLRDRVEQMEDED
jgi:hypothetical protein